MPATSTGIAAFKHYSAASLHLEDKQSFFGEVKDINGLNGIIQPKWEGKT
ncbi:hypothetical protein [Novosphingopyxis sp.]